MQTSNNFAANAITKPLYNKLFGTYGQEFLSTNRTIWVDSDDGSDTTGDGTQERPFQTLSAALLAAHRITTNNYNVTVDFLTDVEEVVTTQHVIAGDFHWGGALP